MPMILYLVGYILKSHLTKVDINNNLIIIFPFRIE